MKKKNTTTKGSTRNIAAEFRMETVPISEIEHAPWNPRSEAEMGKNHPAMEELVESIKLRGVIEPIITWKRAKGARLCIAGNRRLVAARLAGLKTIETKTYTSITEEEARAITRDENEVRFGVSPLADAAQIRQLLDRGLGQNEIAALFGVSEAKVCRRAKLLDLVPEVLELLTVKGIDAHALSLELIAAHPADLQRQAAQEFKNSWYFDWKPKSVRMVFDRLTRQLDANSWIFKDEGVARLERCRHCGKCTGTQPTLFDLQDGDSGEKDGGLGRCLDMGCYAEMEAAAKREIIRAAISKFKIEPAGEIVYAKNSWSEPFESAAKRPSKTNDHAIVYWDSCQHTATVRWMPDPAIARKEKKRMAAESKAAAEARRVEEEASRQLLLSALSKVHDFFADSDGCCSIGAAAAKLSKISAEVLALKLAEMFDDVFAFSAVEPDHYSDPHWAVKNIPELAATLTDGEKVALANAAKEGGAK